MCSGKDGSSLALLGYYCAGWHVTVSFEGRGRFGESRLQNLLVTTIVMDRQSGHPAIQKIAY
ncbi:uncharacterized protein K452DRAFT_284915, partial [Aplosporella prunicola CBS 121167]